MRHGTPLLKNPHQRAHVRLALATIDDLLHQQHGSQHRTEKDEESTHEGRHPVVIQERALLIPVPVHVQHRIAPPVPGLLLTTPLILPSRSERWRR